jgi:hydroxymethylpyrimidine/phosphomethylpyrimidine kinase
MTAVALTIAGSDSGGGAGIQADLKTFSALGVFGTSAIVAITAQNTQGVRAVEDISPAMIAAQLDAVFDDFAVGGVKIGMVSREETVAVIAGSLEVRGIRPVLDPVMVATSGDRLLQPQALRALRAKLLPLALLVTPNLPEAALLTDTAIASGEDEMMAQAKMLVAAGAAAALVKGGHAQGTDSTDVFFDGRDMLRLSAPRIDTPNTHGTGCTLSAAVAAGLARGLSLRDAVVEAKDYLSGALAAGAALVVGRGRGPVHHFHRWWNP